MKAIVIFFFISPSIFANYWTTKKDTAYEVQALVESFKMDFMTEEEKVDLKKKLAQFDSLMNKMEKKDHYFISKTSIYKWLLKNKPNSTPPSSFTLTNFKAKAKPEELSPFPRWLLTALRTDTLQIIQDPQYNAYLKLMEAGNSNYQRMKIHKRIKMIKPWLYLFQTDDATQVDLRMMKFHFDLLNHVISQLKVFHQFNNQSLPAPSKTLSYFSLSDELPAKKNEDSKTLSILDEVIEKHKKANLPLPVDDWSLSDEDSWSPQESLSGELSKLQKINVENPKPDKSYEVPENLPQPIDDWVWD